MQPGCILGYYQTFKKCQALWSRLTNLKTSVKWYHNMKTSNRYLCTIKNDEAGQKFIQTLREMFMDIGKRIKLRGRGPRCGIKRFRQDLPLSLATHFALYEVL